MSLSFTVKEAKRLRVIVDTDAACEADDPFAIAHALMSPKLVVRGILAEHFGTQRTEESTAESYAEIQRVTEAMGLSVPVLMGARAKMASPDDYELSEASQFLIDEAMREDEMPLYVLCLGAVTNVACALRHKPEIAQRMTVVWIGGRAYDDAGQFPPDIREFNAGNDVVAANVLMDTPVPLWQIPMDVYTTMRTSMAELELKVKPCGAIGKHLFDQMVAYNDSEHSWWTMGESWSLGDSPAIGVVLHPGCGRFITREAPVIEEDTGYRFEAGRRPIRVYRSIDSRYILEDFFAKLRLLYSE